MRRLSWSTLLLLCLLPRLLDAQNPSFLSSSYGDELVIGLLINHDFDLNPFEVHSTAQKDIIQLIYGYGLARRSDKLTNPPGLVERLIASPMGSDNRMWRMVLERNINFHNDISLRNTDVQFTFNLVKSHGGFVLNRTFDFSNLRAIRGNGDLEIIFELNRADEKFGLKLSNVPILPRAYYEEAMKAGYAVFERKPPIGMGPFIFEYETNRLIQLRYNPHYHLGRPFLDGVKIRFYEDEQALVDALINGTVDYIEFPDRATARAVHDLVGEKLVVFLIPRPERRVFTMLFNVNRFPLSEIEVRRAIYMALDREEIVNRFMKDIGRVAHTIINESSPFFERSLFNEAYNPKQAQRMLENAGWRLNPQTNLLEKNGRPLSFELYFSRNSEFEAGIARAILTQLFELGIKVEPVPVLPMEKHRILSGSSYQAMIYDYTFDPDYLFEAVEQFYTQILGADQLVPNYTNQYLTRLFELTRAGQSPEKNLFQRFQTFVAQQRPAVYLFFDERSIIGINQRFQQYRSTFTEGNRIISRLSPIENWYVPKEMQKR